MTQRIALIADVHGNDVALDAVLADIAQQDCQSIICLGDLAAVGPRPAEALARVRSACDVVLQGNTDAWLTVELSDELIPPDVRQRKDKVRQSPEHRFARERLTEEDCLSLARLPFSHVVQPNGDASAGLLCVHGSPRSYNEGVFADTPETEALEICAGVQQGWITAGHTHRALQRTIGRWTWINPGSVGLTRDGEPGATYGIFAWDGERWSYQHRHVPYDIAAVVRDIQEQEMWNAAKLSRWLQNGTDL